MDKGLTRDSILGMKDKPTKRVEVPEWAGGHVHVRTMSALERDEYEITMAKLTSDDRVVNFRARLVARTACDAAGKRLFNENDADALGELSGMAVGRVYEAAAGLNGLSPDSMREIEADLPPGQSDTSSTG